MNVSLQVKLPVTIFREGKCFIAHTPVLDLATSASSFPRVRQRFSELIEIFFEELAEKGTLVEVLTSLGWRRVNREWNPPLVVAQETTTVRIPLSS